MDNDTIFFSFFGLFDLKCNLNAAPSVHHLFWCDLLVASSTGGHADLRRLPHRLDPLRGGFGGVSVWCARFSAHSRVCHPNVAGQVLGHVQPHHLPGGGPETLLRQVCLF